MILAIALVTIPALPSAAAGQGKLLAERTGSAATIDAIELEQLPPMNRDPWYLFRQTPGVVPANGERGPGDGVQIRGQNESWTIDGVVIGGPDLLANPSTYTQFQPGEFDVVRGGAQAEYGSFTGGLINVITKSGRNEFSGSLSVSRPDEDWEARATDGFDIRILEQDQGGFCLDAFTLAGGTPAPGTGFAVDLPFTIGIDPATGRPIEFQDSDWSVNFAVIPPCTGKEYGLGFVDTPRPVTPALPSTFFFGSSGVYGIDLFRIGARHGLGDAPSRSNFFIRAQYDYQDGGFRQVPDPSPSPTGRGTGFFLYGIESEGLDLGDPARFEILRDPFSIRYGGWSGGTDFDGDGGPDSFFLGNLDAVCPNVIGGTFVAGTRGESGGFLQSDPSAPGPDCNFLQDRMRLNDYITLNVGIRRDALESAAPADAAGVDAGSLFRSSGDFPFQPRLGGAFRTSGGLSSGGRLRGYGMEVGGPIVKDRFWIWGTYGNLDERPGEDRLTYFTPRDYGSHFSPGGTSFSGSAFNPSPIQSAPAGRGVQDAGIELRLGYLEDAALPSGERYAPGGAAEPLYSVASAEEPLLYIVARGGSTGDVYDVVVVHPPGGRVAIDGVVVVEPVAATGADRERYERELARVPGTRETVTAAGYCLELDRHVPPPGTVYRVASAAKQARYTPMRRALEAAGRVRDAGGLDPDSDPESYFHSIRQWAVWTVEKSFDRQSFLDAFVERTEKNFRDAGQPWSAEVASQVRTLGEGRWTDIREVLDEAGATP